MTLPAFLTQVMLDSPVSLWALTDAVGASTAADINPTEFGPSAPGVVTATTFGVASPIPGLTAASFPVGTSVITASSTWDPSNNNHFSLEAWAKITSLNSTTQRMLGREAASNHGVFLFVGLDNNFRILRGDSGGGIDQPTINPSAISTATWYHLGVSYDGANILTYFNGAFHASSASSRLAAPGASSFTIGKTANGGTSGCSLFTVAAYNYPLTATQWANHYAAWQQSNTEYYLPFPAGFQPWDVSSFGSIDAWYTENYQGGGFGTVPTIGQDVIVGLVFGTPVLKYWALPSAINPLG